MRKRREPVDPRDVPTPLRIADGRVVVAEGNGEGWWIYVEGNPEAFIAGTLDGMSIAEVLDYDVETYPDEWDEWAEKVKQEA